MHTHAMHNEEVPVSEQMPHNMIEGAERPVRDDAAKEAEWLAANVPAGGLELHWRYASRNIQLFERHLRSLANYGVGPALRSYLRTRLEWLKDEKLFERPEGIVVVTVAPNGEVDAYLDDATPVPALSLGDLAAFDGTVWTLSEGVLCCTPAHDEMRGACETFARDLAKTLATSLGYEYVGTPLEGEVPAEAEVFAINDEFGLIPVANAAELTAKMVECFDKLWAQEPRR